MDKCGPCFVLRRCFECFGEETQSKCVELGPEIGNSGLLEKIVFVPHLPGEDL